MTQVFVVTAAGQDALQAHNPPVAVFSSAGAAEDYIAGQKAVSGAAYDWRATGYTVDAFAPVKHADAEPEDEPPKHAKAHEPEPPPPPKGGKR